MKLLEHFRAMQEMATRYLMPEPYVDLDGQNSKVIVGLDGPVRNQLFAGDMIYMLDGPEQREAQAEVLADGDRLLATIEPAFRAGFQAGMAADQLEAETPAWETYKPEGMTDRQVVVRFALRKGISREQLIDALITHMTEEGLSIFFDQVAELEVDGVVHLNV